MSYRINEAAAKLHLSEKTLRRWEQAGKITPNRTEGGKRRFETHDIQVLDAIKHGLIDSDKDLLSPEEAARLLGLDETTFEKYEQNGQFHPLITSTGIYYPKKRLLRELKNSIQKTAPQPLPILSPARAASPKADSLHLILTNLLITLLVLLIYHLLIFGVVK